MTLGGKGQWCPRERSDSMGLARSLLKNIPESAHHVNTDWTLPMGLGLYVSSNNKDSGLKSAHAADRL